MLAFGIPRNRRHSRLQVRKLKAQLEQKTQKNGSENGSSTDGDILENGTDPNIAELQSTNPRTPEDTL